MDDYELLPHEELEQLRHEVERLKKSPYPTSKQNKTLLDSMDALTTSINKLIKIFEGAQDDMIKDYAESNPSKLLKQISEQNTKIAEGIVTMVNMVRAPKAPVRPMQATQPTRQTQPIPLTTAVPNNRPIPPMSPMPQSMSAISVPPANIDPDTPALESIDLPEKTDRKGLFSAFKK